MSFPSVVFITEMDFWRDGSGCRARSLGLVGALSSATQLTVISNCRRMPSDDALIKRLKLNFTHYWLDPNIDLSLEEKIEKLVPVLASAKVVVFRSYHNSFLIRAVPQKCLSFIDVDDLRSDYCETKLKVGIKSDPFVSFEEENKIFSQFDKIMLIQKEHYQKFLKFYSSERLILVPPKIPTKIVTRGQTVNRIGFLASGWEANIDGLQWFLREVWPQLMDLKVTLDIYGLICSKLNGLKESNVRLMGSVNRIEDFYSQIDIAINPVRYGSGIKIKSLEALSHGIPVICTPEGARGIVELDKQGLFIAETSSAFVEAIRNLINDDILRYQLSKTGLEYVRKNFGTNTYDDLLTAINFSAFDK